MKKVFYFSFMMVAMFALAACSSTDTPSGAMTKYATYLIQGNYEKFVEGFAFDQDLTPEKKNEQKEFMVSMLKEKASKTLEESGGLKKFEILSEEISEDGLTATLKTKQTFGNGEEKEGVQKMIKKGNDWLMDLDK